MHESFALHHFGDEGFGFQPREYSMLKFGSVEIAKEFGKRLADAFFMKHMAVLLANRVVVIPSPYNHVPNAATIMTKYFVNRLNEQLVHENGSPVEYDTIHRKVSYINDYGFLNKEKREALINNDDFYMNIEFLEGKLLIFVDDVNITGTHERKLIDIMKQRGIKNDAFFVYYGKYGGLNAAIESRINFAGIRNVHEYVDFIVSNEAHIIIRPMKMLLGSDPDTLEEELERLTPEHIYDIYHACLAEGYFRLPAYQKTFDVVRRMYNKRYE
jgi:hypothetical protein